MSILLLRTHPDPVLRTPAAPVTAFDDRLARLVAEMIRQMHRHGGVGLAAPQLGVSQRVIVIRDGSTDRHLVNPVLVTRSTQLETGVEGCLSLPGVFAELPRHATVAATGFDLDGAPVSLDASGLLSRCVQHEVDHLDGVLFIDRLTASERNRVLAAYREAGLSPRLGRSPSDHQH